MTASPLRRTRQKNGHAAKSTHLMMALEPRIMFDAAAVVAVDHAVAEQQAAPQVAEAEPTPTEANTVSIDPVDSGLPASPIFVVPEGAPANLKAAQQEAQAALLDYIARTDAQTLFEIFNGQQDVGSAEWLAFAESLREQILSGQYQIDVVLLDNATLKGALGAFAAAGTDGTPVLYLNRDWMSNVADAPEIARVLIEELGHSLDARLNPVSDTSGDEGWRFARAVFGETFDSQSPGYGDDHDILLINAQATQVELASYNFVNAYSMVYDLNNDGVINPNERLAEKEQNSHYLNTAGLSVAFVSDDTNSHLFSGNDVSAIGINIVTNRQSHLP